MEFRTIIFALSPRAAVFALVLACVISLQPVYGAERLDLGAVQKAVTEYDFDKLKMVHRSGLSKAQLNKVGVTSVVDHDGRTLLHLAAESGDLALVNFLLKLGVDAKIKDRNGFNSLDLAINQGQLAVLQALLKTISGPEDFPAGQGHFDDRRIVYWRYLYWSNDIKAMLKEVEKDLLSDDAHILSPFIWSITHSRLERLPTVSAKASAKLKQALGKTLHIELLWDANRFDAMLDEFPVSLEYQRTDIFALVKLARAAQSTERYDLSKQYLEIAIKLLPDFWQLAWMYDTRVQDDALLQKRAVKFSKDAAIQGTLTSQYIQQMTTQRVWDRVDQMFAKTQWLVEKPDDARLQTSMAFNYASGWRYFEALPHAQKGVLHFPWYSNFGDVIFYMIRLERFEQAKRYAALTSRWYQQEDLKLAARSASEFAGNLITEGDKGRARAVLEAELRQQPDEPMLAATMAKLELSDKRYAEATMWAKRGLVESQLDSRDVLEDLIDALIKDGDGFTAIDTYLAAVENYHFLPVSLHLKGLGALKDAKRWIELDTQIDKVLLKLPGAKAIRKMKAESLWRNNRQREALELAGTLVNRHPTDKSLISLYVQYSFEVKGLEVKQAGDIDNWFRKRLADQPWNEVLAKQYLDHLALGSDVAEAVTFWRALQEKNSGEYFACQNLVSALVRDKQWQRAWDEAAACRDDAITSGARSGAQLSTSRTAIYVIEQWSKRRSLDSEFLERSASDWREVANRLKENLESYYRYEEQICQALQDKQCAAEALLQRSLYRRSNTAIYHDLVAKYGDELNARQRLGYGAKMLARDPYNVSILNSFLHKQLRWAGSPIVALKAIRDAKARGLSPASTYESDALGKLGDPFSKYEGYVRGSFPGASKRYVDWFHASRRSALSEEAKQIRYLFDEEHPGIEIVLPNGEVATRRDHALFGKIAYLSRGAGYVRFEYTDDGMLSLIEESSGKRIELEYNDLGEIDRFQNADGKELLFTYNEKSKPIVIEIKGVGHITVEYNDAGEILKVDSPQGQEMAMQVTRSFQELLSLVSSAENADKLERLPAFEFVDQKLQDLKADYESAKYGTRSHRASQELLAAYLVDHVKDSTNYFDEATYLLMDMIEAGQASLDGGAKLRAARAINLWHKLHRVVKPHGLPEYDFATWSALRNWLVSYSIQSDNREAKKLLGQIDLQPLSLLRDAHWLNRSNLMNSGFWKRSGDEALFGPNRPVTRKNGLLIRSNGDVVVASNLGLSVYRLGHWQWFGFDDSIARFSNNVSLLDISASSDILSLEETSNGVLWLGTARGLYALEGDYQAKPRRWRSKEDGLASPRIDALAVNGTQIIAATPRGVVAIAGTDSVAEGVLNANEIHARKLVVVEGWEDEALLALDDKGLHLIDDLGKVTVADNAVKFAYSPDNELVYWMESNGLIYSQYMTIYETEIELSEEPPKLLGRPKDLMSSKQINELAIWSVPGIGETLVVNSDVAINILNDNYFQSMPLPYEVTRGGLELGPTASVTWDQDIVAVTEEGVYSFMPSEITQIEFGETYDLLSDDELGLTYIATGDSIVYIDHSNREQYEWFHSASARHLAQDSAGNLITHDGNTILRFDRHSTQPKELFSASQTVDVDWWKGRVNALMVDSNDVIWVAAGSSVFRFENETLTEFNYLIDSKVFPSRSQMIYNVYEDIKGDIYAVASNEGHLSYKGIDLTGGALKWNGEGFTNLGSSEHWFVTGYTPMNDGTAVVGTNQTLVREKSGQRKSFDALNDPTFSDMKNKSKMLWLGGEGARLGTGDSWLFPTAGGIVVFHEGQWFYPDRLNQLLPGDQALGQYGARTVHSVSVDGQGAVYVGTDLGVLVYEADGIESLLTDNYRGQVAFSSQETTKHRDVSDVFLNAIDRKSAQGKLLNRYDKLNSDLSDAQSLIDTQASVAGMSDTEGEQSAADELKRKLRDNERSRQRLLARMEKEEPGLFQMLKFDPREASAMHERLTEDQALIQYLPTTKKLQIQVVTSDGTVIRQVDIPREKLMQESTAVAHALRAGVHALSADSFRGLTLEEVTVVDSKEVNQARLVWLYDTLLRPIERDLEGKTQIFITPVGALSYIPFGALIRRLDTEIEYAVERFNIGILPSLFHYNLVMGYAESYVDDVLMISDPDGSLPGARKEVGEIAGEMSRGKVILEGDEATLEAVDEFAPESRIIHFATHGVLDEDSPADSYLLLADQRRLSVVDISTMDLSQTDIVVLSACQSGIGATGLEYATLARAFAHARVPTVVASYWEVDDGATRMLMRYFYEAMGDEDSNYFAALSTAQRRMLDRGGDAADPSAWSGFSVFGRP